jgi:hypothetical protein
LKSEVSEEDFKTVVETLEKILLNILENPTNEKYYRIKNVRIKNNPKDSHHFQKIVNMNPHSFAVFEIFGFKLNIAQDNHELNPQTELSFLRGIFFDYKNVVSQVLK